VLLEESKGIRKTAVYCGDVKLLESTAKLLSRVKPVI